MKVCGVSFIRNAVKYDFPIVEAINSVLPLCDHFVIAVGQSEDSTKSLIESIAPGKITIVETVWDEKLRVGGKVYADETNKAFDAVPEEYDWCYYIQGDEVIHEKHLPEIRKAMETYLDRKEVEGLLLNFKHFFGSYNYVGDCRHWYRKEIRVVRNNKSIRSYKDAQGFRKNGQKLKVVPLDADVFHYGWVRHPKAMQQKIDSIRAFFDNISEAEAQQKALEQDFDYLKEFDALALFQGIHPQVMKERIARLNWDFQPDLKKMNMKWKYRWLHRIEKWTGARLFEYRNYEILK